MILNDAGTANYLCLERYKGSDYLEGYVKHLHLETLELWQGHLATAGEEACTSVETRLLPPGAVANRSRLQAEADAWLQQLGEFPPGNRGDAGIWQVNPCKVYAPFICGRR
jgi:hypothetical protein